MAAVKSKLLNYTTEIEATKTLSEIQARLVAHGASHVAAGYGPDRLPNTISFRLETKDGPRFYTIPVDAGRVLNVMQVQSNKGLIPQRYCSRAQAARVGWRIVFDMIKVQLSLAEIGLATVEEVLLGFLQVNGMSMYQLVAEKRIGLPAPKRE